MILKERDFLLAEIHALEEMISRIPEENVLDRISLEDRKTKVEEDLAVLTSPYHYEPVRARLTFRGKPVLKNDGVIADFAGNALDKFADMVGYIGASRDGLIGEGGPVSNLDRYRMMITGASPFGSFGFDLEEAPNDDSRLDPELSPVKKAIDDVALIIMQASGLSDDDLADAIEDVHPMAINKIRDFLRVMTDNEAICILESDDKTIQFDNIDQIKFIEEQLSPDRIFENDLIIVGRFGGALEDRRTFEFWIEDQKEMIFGKLGPGIKDIDKIHYIASQRKPVEAHVHKKQVGTSRPKYTLNMYKEL